MTKRTLSIVLVLVMVLSLLPAQALALSLSSNIAIEPVYDEVRSFGSDYAPVCLDGKWGLINKLGEVVLAPKYDWMGYCEDDYVVAAKYEPLEYDGTMAYVLYLVTAEGEEYQLEDPTFCYSVGDLDATGPLHWGTLKDLLQNQWFDWGYEDGTICAAWYSYDLKGNLIWPNNPEILENPFEYKFDYFYRCNYALNGIIPMVALNWDAYFDGLYQFFYMDYEGNIVKTFPVSHREEDDFYHVGISAPDDGVAYYEIWYKMNSDDKIMSEGYYIGLMNEDSTNYVYAQERKYDVVSYYVGGDFVDNNLVSVRDSGLPFGAGNGNYGVINARSGFTVVPFNYQHISAFYDGWATAERDGNNYFLHAVNGIVEEYAVAAPDGGTLRGGMVTPMGKVGVAAVYDEVSDTTYCVSMNPVDGVLPIVEGSEKTGYSVYFADTDNDGYTDLFVTPDELIAVQGDNGKWGFALLELEYDNPFTDLKEGAFYVDAVLWAVYNNITTGTTATSFEPESNCTRAQIVTFLWRAAGCPAPTVTEHSFVDVKEDSFYYDAMLWAVEKGVTTGTDATHFSPNMPCTRNQAVTFLYRAAGSPAPESTDHVFADVAQGSYFYDAVLWAVENGVTNGVSAESFAPTNECTRGQIVTFLYRSSDLD